jgi:hypothetical protein
MSDKQQVSIFRIAFEEVKELLLEKVGLADASADDIINHISNLESGERKSAELKFKKNITDHFKPYLIRGFFATVPVDFGWADFFEPHLTENHDNNQRLLSSRRTYHKSFFVFIYSEDNVYCFSGGLGYHYLKDFIDDDFGISILQRLDLDEDLHLMMLKSRSVVGNIAVDQRIFRNVHRTTDENNLGKIYREIAAKLPYSSSMSNLKAMIFENKIHAKKNIHAGQSFKFSKSISLKVLSEVITFFDEHITKDPKFVLSSLKPIKKDKEHSKILVRKLNRLLHIELYSILATLFDDGNTENSGFYEVTNSKFMRFYECDRLTITRRGKSDLAKFESPYGIDAKQLISSIIDNDRVYIAEKIAEIRRHRNADTVDALKIELISSYSLNCFNSELGKDHLEINGKIVEFLTGEITDGETPYFYLDSIWYRSEENFLAKLNQEFASIYASNRYEFDLEDWGTVEDDNENKYLERVAEAEYENTLVLHKVTRTANMELCDILTWDDKDIYFIHVKPSFDGDVRVLVHQISHACRLIEEDLRNGPTITSNLGRYFKEASTYGGTSKYLRLVKKQFNGWSFQKFAKLFSNRRMNYVAAIVDSSGRSLDDIADFDSNIAKMSIIEGYRAIRASGSPNSRFLISQIPHEE